MRSLSLRARILLISSALLTLLTAATLAYVGTQANGYVNQRLVDDLRRSQDLIASVQRDRLARLQLAAQVVASFPHLRALAGTDAATIHDFLVDYAQRNAFAELLILFDPAGNVLARTDTLAAEAIPDVNERWLQPALANRVATGLLATTRGVYQVAVTPAEAGGTVFGFLLAGAPIQDTYARALSDVSHTEIVVLGPGRVLGSTLRQDELPWRSQRAWRDAFGTAPGPHVAIVAGERYAAMAAPSIGHAAARVRAGGNAGGTQAGGARLLRRPRRPHRRQPAVARSGDRAVSPHPDGSRAARPDRRRGRRHSAARCWPGASPRRSRSSRKARAKSPRAISISR